MMRSSLAGIAVLVAAILLASSPAPARKAGASPVAGFWAYDKSCPATDDGFALARDGTASDGQGAYVGRWTLRKGRVRIVWNATKSERAHIKRGKWRIVEVFRLIRKPKRRARLRNIKGGVDAWLCRKY
ncbi:MAG: hypothetical protein ACTSUD_02610 [Alphaproteobacteria bacterium]